MLWLQAVSHGGAPVATKRTPDGKKPSVQIRRQVWERRHGPVPEGLVVAVSCGHQTCLTHLETITRAEVVRRQWAKKDERAKLTAAITQASRKRAKTDMQAAREIRASNQTLEVVAAQHGISVTLASLIRRGERWREVGNPFAGLGG